MKQTVGRQVLKRWSWPGLLAIVSVFSSGCGVIGGKIASTSDPAGDQARNIWDLFVTPIWWLTVAVFLLVTVWLLLNITLFRRKPGDTRIPEQVHGHTRLEVVWSLIPAVILALILVPSTRLIFELNRDPGPDSDAITVNVIGHQWWWEFQYPDYNIVTAGDLHLVVNRPVRLLITSKDVIHSFWPPRLAGKVDAVPGRENTMVFTPEETGIFYGQCAELCGAQHAHMQFRVVVQTQEEFDAWVSQQQQPAVEPPAGTLAAQGKELFLGSAGCYACHTIQGTQAQAKVGPNLTHFASRNLIAAFLPNTSENLHRWLTDPAEVKPYTKMVLPRKLSGEEVAALVAYLQTLQ